MSRNIKFKIPDRDDSESESSSILSIRDDARASQTRVRGHTGFRLGLLCLMLVMVVIAMNHASKPESWNWLFGFNRVDVVETADGEHSDPNRSQSFNDNSTSQRSADAPPVVPDIDSNINSAPKLELQFWTYTLEQLDGQAQVRLFNLIHNAAKQTELPAGSTASINPVLSRLKKLRSGFTSQLEPSEWRDDFIRTWNDSLLPAFAAVIGDRPDPVLIDSHVENLISNLKMASSDLIRDKTPVDRGREAYAWFSAWSEIFDQPIEMQVDEQATVTQLLAQPDVWRGQTLNVEGTALRVERVEASHNALGIQQYYVIWIKPDHPSVYPYCVYSLMAPESLMGEPSEKMRIVEQRVSTTATFFKNRLFNADRGDKTEAAYGPVLLTAAIEIPFVEIDSTRSRFEMPGRNVVFLSIGLIGGLALLIAVSVYRSTQSGRARALPKTDQLERDFTVLKQDKRVETTVEKLQRMSQINPEEVGLSGDASSEEDSDQ